MLLRDARPSPVRPLTGAPTSRGSTPLSKKVKTDEFSGAVAGWTDPAVVTLAARLSAGSAAAMGAARRCHRRSEEHTSELQSRENLVCRLLLEKKKNKENVQSDDS